MPNGYEKIRLRAVIIFYIFMINHDIHHRLEGSSAVAIIRHVVIRQTIRAIAHDFRDIM